MRSSPVMPWALLTRPTSRPGESFEGSPARDIFGRLSLDGELVDDVEMSTPADFGRSGGQNRPHGLGGTPILADDLADVVLGDLELDQRIVIALDFSHLDAVGVVDQSLGDRCNQFLEGHNSATPVSVGRLSARLGAGDGEKKRREKHLEPRTRAQG